MRKLFYIVIFLSAISISACNGYKERRDWIKTSNGLYFYGKVIKDKSAYSWAGSSKGFVIDGKGKLSVFSGDGDYNNDAEVNAYYGSIAKSDWKKTPSGQFLGEVKDNNPEGFGVLNDGKLVKCGIFSKGILNDTLCYIYYNNGKLKYKGGIDEGKYDGYGLLQKENGDTLYIGYFKNGYYTKSGKIFKNGVVSYIGEFADGLPNGTGKSYDKSGYLKYNGEWKNGKYDGNGTLYFNKAVVYKGEWKDGLYDGDGILYVNGEAHKGSWSKGHENIYLGDQIKNVYNIVTNKKTDSKDRNISKMYQTADVFLDSLSTQFADLVEKRVQNNVEDRFGILDAFIRIPFQSLFTSQIKRMDYANDKLTKGLKKDDLQDWINGRISEYNHHATKGEQFNTIELKDFKKHEIVNGKVFDEILNRENLENANNITDLIIGGIIWLVITIICAIIGVVVPGAGTALGCIVQIIQSAIIGVFLYFLIDIHMPDLENKISSDIIQNYTEYFNNQNIMNQLYEK